MKKSEIEKYFHLYQKLLNQIYLINLNERSIHKVLTIEGYTYMMHWVKQNIRNNGDRLSQLPGFILFPLSQG